MSGMKLFPLKMHVYLKLWDYLQVSVNCQGGEDGITVSAAAGVVMLVHGPSHTRLLKPVQLGFNNSPRASL